jgi:hypothetical protein
MALFSVSVLNQTVYKKEYQFRVGLLKTIDSGNISILINQKSRQKEIVFTSQIANSDTMLLIETSINSTSHSNVKIDLYSAQFYNLLFESIQQYGNFKSDLSINWIQNNINPFGFSFIFIPDYSSISIVNFMNHSNILNLTDNKNDQGCVLYNSGLPNSHYISFNLLSSNNSKATSFISFIEGWSIIYGLQFHSNGFLIYHDGNSWQNLMSYNSNQFYHVIVRDLYNNNIHTITIYIDGIQKVSFNSVNSGNHWLSLLQTSQEDINYSLYIDSYTISNSFEKAISTMHYSNWISNQSTIPIEKATKFEGFNNSKTLIPTSFSLSEITNDNTYINYEQIAYKLYSVQYNYSYIVPYDYFNYPISRNVIGNFSFGNTTVPLLTNNTFGTFNAQNVFKYNSYGKLLEYNDSFLTYGIDYRYNCNLRNTTIRYNMNITWEIIFDKLQPDLFDSILSFIAPISILIIFPWIFSRYGKKMAIVGLTIGFVIVYIANFITIQMLILFIMICFSLLYYISKRYNSENDFGSD